ncbi:hypothetical protein Y032_0467g1989 [Ancylostoma ceylanicum]|nr:hypothetical protein Y032_0467g1989 [Ancylostoma ceylanicum]
MLRIDHLSLAMNASLRLPMVNELARVLTLGKLDFTLGNLGDACSPWLNPLVYHIVIYSMRGRENLG